MEGKMKSRIKSFATGTKIFCLGVLFWFSYQSRAASVGVNIETNAFDPSVVAINVNDQVVWTWVSDFHNTESTTDLWDSPIENTGFVFTNVFTSAGTFPYFCVVHGFSGDVDVSSASVTNTGMISVTLTNPPDGSVFGNTDPVTIGALVNDTNGTVTNVSFFSDGVLLRSVSASPFVLITAPFTFSLGAHVLTATMADDSGLMATSAPVQLSVARYTAEVTNGVGRFFSCRWRRTWPRRCMA
jgi:plastocyanin